MVIVCDPQFAIMIWLLLCVFTIIAYCFFMYLSCVNWFKYCPVSTSNNCILLFLLSVTRSMIVVVVLELLLLLESDIVVVIVELELLLVIATPVGFLNSPG